MQVVLVHLYLLVIKNIVFNEVFINYIERARRLLALRINVLAKGILFIFNKF